MCIDELAKDPKVQEALRLGLEARDKALWEDVNDGIGAFNIGALTVLAFMMGNSQ